jgi:hypothetical protein
VPKEYSDFDFLIDGIERYRKSHHGDLPIRMEISPETWQQVCSDKRIMAYIDVTKEGPPKLCGVPAVIIKGCPPRLFTKDGKLEEI